jgi:hypothetical protein
VRHLKRLVIGADGVGLLGILADGGPHQSPGPDIPTSDGPKVATLAGCVEHVVPLGRPVDKETAR